MAKKILIDTDGVLRDFVDGCEEKYECKFDFTNSSSIQNILGKSNEEFISDLDTISFWKSLKPTKEAQSIIKMVYKYFKEEDIYIVSSSYQTPRILAGCAAWYKRYLPSFYKHKKIIFIANKSLLANLNTILLDDHTDACKAFSNRSGWTILMPRPWNSAYQTKFPMDRVENELTMILNRVEVDGG